MASDLTGETANEALRVDGALTLESDLTLTLQSQYGNVNIVSMGEIPDLSGNVFVDASYAVSLSAGTVQKGLICINTEDEIPAIEVLGGSTGSITLRCGEEGVGASIKLVTLPEPMIILQVGEVIMTITAEGIFEEVVECSRELTAEGHNFTAGELEENLNISGRDVEYPVNAEVKEAGDGDVKVINTEVTAGTSTVENGIETEL